MKELYIYNNLYPFQVNDELSSRLEQRETQLLTVSKDKAKLEEECDNLKE